MCLLQCHQGEAVRAEQSSTYVPKLNHKASEVLCSPAAVTETTAMAGAMRGKTLLWGRHALGR